MILWQLGELFQIFSLLCISGILISIETPSYTTTEGDPSVEVCVLLNGTLERTVNFTLTVSNGTAKGLLDSLQKYPFTFFSFLYSS